MFISLIRVNSRILQNPNIPISAFSCYIALLIQRGLNGNFAKSMLTSRTDMCFYLVNNLEEDNGLVKHISHGVKHLSDIGINFDVHSKKSKYIINMSEFKDLENYDVDCYVDIELDDLHKIYNINSPYRFRLARYYMFLCSLLTDTNQSVGQWNLDKLCELLKLPPQTVHLYDRYLKRLEIMDCDDFFVVQINGTYQPHFFAQWKDKELMQQAIEDFNSIVSVKDISDGRKMWQKYQWLLKGKEYSYDEIKQIYVYILEQYKHNSFIANNAEVGSPKYLRAIDRLSRIDFSCFEEYDFCENTV